MRLSIAASAILIASATAWSTDYSTECTTTMTKTMHSDKPKPLPVTTASSSEKPAPNPVSTTVIVTELTTFCPSPTTFVHGTTTYTVTEVSSCLSGIAKNLPRDTENGNTAH